MKNSIWGIVEVALVHEPTLHVLLQVTGRKRWTICPPEEKPYLYEVPPEIYGKGSSNLNTFDVVRLRPPPPPAVPTRGTSYGSYTLP